MRRLLWKEWHELRWYLVGFLLGPVLFAWWLNVRNGMTLDSSYGPLFWAMVILLSFFAATRLSKDVRPEYMSVQWLPINRWVVWLIKFVPGFVVALLLPLWIHWVVTVIGNMNPGPGGLNAISAGSYGPGVSTAVYACVFAASMFLPSLAAVLVGLLAACMTAGYMPYLFELFSSSEARYASVAVIAMAVSIGAWRRPAGSSEKSRALSAGVGVLIGLIPALAVMFLVSVQGIGLEKVTKDVKGYWAGQSSPNTALGRPWLCDGPSSIASPDGKCVAHMAEVWKNPGARNRLEILDTHGLRIEVPDPTAFPAAWLPNENLLVYTGLSGQRITVNEFDLHTGLLNPLVSFAAPKRDRRSVPIMEVYPEPSGNRVVLAVRPRSGIGWDIWVLDRRTKSCRVLCPGVSLQGYSTGSAWDGDSLVLSRMGAYWRFHLDGSPPQQVKVSIKEASSD